MIKKITLYDLNIKLNNHHNKELLKIQEIKLSDVDLSHMKLDHIDFSLCHFKNVSFDNADLSYSIIENALFVNCTFRKTNFRYANMKGATLRYNDLSGADIRGANLFSSVLEHANLDNIIYDDETKFFKMYCPEEGAFLGYKKCLYDRLVQLLIPADAKRSSATLNACRCSKAKVLTIKSFDYKEEFDEAWSLVDENFVYKKGEWVEVLDFDEDRWNDSTRGIHFWMTREEAMRY